MIHPADSQPGKQQWRRALAADRDAVSHPLASAEAEAIGAAVLDHVSSVGIATVAGYVPVGAEPGSLRLLDQLRERDVQVLLPVVVGSEPLDWAEYHGADALRPARYGLREPSSTRLGPQAIGAAELVLVPALGIDRQGVRLGRGAGHYDRSLVHAAPDAELIAVVRDAEFVPELPGEDHDVRMTGVVTPERGVLRLAV